MIYKNENICFGSIAYPFSENRQNRREKVSRDDQEERIKESRKFNVQKGKDRKKVKKQLENRIQELGQEIHELKVNLACKMHIKNIFFFIY